MPRPIRMAVSTAVSMAAAPGVTPATAVRPARTRTPCAIPKTRAPSVKTVFPRAAKTSRVASSAVAVPAKMTRTVQIPPTPVTRPRPSSAVFVSCFGCDDSNDCLAGFACEDGACADRRVPCVSGADCPHGFTCFFPAADQRFCRRITRPCDNDVDCLTLGVPCGDADGVGGQECMPSLMPNASDPVSCNKLQCLEADARVCESSVEGTVAVCGRFGPCASIDDCVPGFDCQDLWGDGRKECVLPGGSCVDSSVCAPREVCATPRTGTPPECTAGSAMCSAM